VGGGGGKRYRNYKLHKKKMLPSVCFFYRMKKKNTAKHNYKFLVKEISISKDTARFGPRRGNHQTL